MVVAVETEWTDLRCILKVKPPDLSEGLHVGLRKWKDSRTTPEFLNTKLGTEVPFTGQEDQGVRGGPRIKVILGHAGFETLMAHNETPSGGDVKGTLGC